MAEPSVPLQRPSGWLLWAAGLPGVAAISLQALPALLAGRPLPQPLWVIQCATAAQTAMLLGVAVFAGCRCAPRVGLAAPLLGAVLQGRDWRAIWRRQWPAGTVVGALGAVLLLWVMPALMPAAIKAYPAQPDMPAVARVLYGGITEELLVRWGAMSVIAWGLWRALQRRGGEPKPSILWCAIVLSALLFGLGHLPAAQTLFGQLTPNVISYLLAGNGAFGLLAGWLFWRRGLEAAILAHVTAHALTMLVAAIR